MNRPDDEKHVRAALSDGVTVSFDGFRALNNLSLLIEPGEMRAIIGPNGAGKTTMMDVITGKTRPDTGDRRVRRQADLTKLDEASIATLGIGRKFQKPTVFESHTVRDNLLLALAGRAAGQAAARHADTRRRTAPRRDPVDHPLDRSSTCWRPASATARSSGWRSACCWRRIPSCCWSTNRSPA
jgi:ABC-type uncharacterized transport system ATPase subunit